jgi:hypothetical protein
MMRPRLQTSRAFTFPELVLGMAVTTLVMGAMATFSFAMVKAWRHSETSQSLHITSTQTGSYLQQVLQSALYLGVCRTGALDDAVIDLDDDSNNPATQASLIFWRSDLNEDHRMQLSELAMIENVRGKLLYYESDPLGSLAGSMLTDALRLVSIDDILANSAVEDLKAWLIFRKPKLLANNVTEAKFTVDRGSATRRPSVTMTLKFKENNQTLIHTVTATLRSPRVPD